ncbi:MAG: LPS export ABC transporter periplasmic protein LptC [Gammaproteobacteria bacterium]|nr:LPS export ABC transporter periplasmic protein LptC [Gammaproteobacteria bacterium]
MTLRILALLAVVTLLVAVVVLSGGERQGAAPVTLGVALPDPGYSARQVRLVQTGADGRPVYTVEAAEARQQPQQDTVTLRQVGLTFRDANGNNWTARAARAELAQPSGLIRLEGDVHVAGIIPGSSDKADITTQHLAFDTTAQVIATRDPVTVLMSGRKLDAAGLVASLKDHHVQLESAVHGTFLP